jgi:tetratricopeptide (TPR) repeat protein
MKTAQEIDYRPIHVEARFRLGRAASSAGQFELAERELERTFLDAVSVGHDRVAVKAGTALVFLLGHNQGRLEGARRWYSATDAIVRRRGERHEEVVSLVSAFGSALKRAGQIDEALKQFERAMEMSEAKYGPDHYECATPLNNLGNALLEQGKIEEARRYFERSRDLYERERGTRHPSVGYLHANLAAIEARLNRPAAAEPLFRRALEVWEPTLGPDHPDVVATRANLGRILVMLERTEEARLELEAARDARLRGIVDGHPPLEEIEQLLKELDQQ